MNNHWVTVASTENLGGDRMTVDKCSPLLYKAEITQITDGVIKIENYEFLL